MKEFLIEGSPNSAVIMGEYVLGETEVEARSTWNRGHSGWFLERISEVKPGHNHLGQARPGCPCGCPCHATEVPGQKSACRECAAP